MDRRGDQRGRYEPILDLWHFRPGENFALRMQEAAAQADLTLVVLSKAYLQAAYTQPEWAAAFTHDPTGKARRLIPVRVGKCAVTGLLRSRFTCWPGCVNSSHRSSGVGRPTISTSTYQRLGGSMRDIIGGRPALAPL